MSSQHPAAAWERALSSELGPDWIAVGGAQDRGVDLMTRDGAQVIAVKLSSIHGARDLHASLTHLAIYLGAHKDVRRATFIATFPRMSAERVRREWDRVQTIMRPGVGGRLALVALAPDGDTVLPDDEDARYVAAKARRSLPTPTGTSQPRAASTPRWSRKTYEVWKILLESWLRRESPLALHEIERRSGASYPVVSGLLDRLETSGELERTSSRSAALNALPRRSLAEVLALGDGLRETHRFIDRSGRSSDARDLVRRFARAADRNAALGGVEAARHYMPSFDLNGLPRVDVTVTLSDDLGWVKKIDPALAEGKGAPEPAPTLVVHRLRRPDPRFEKPAASAWAFADPAEVLLDLHELRLVDQADEFVRAMRESSR